MLYLNIIEKVNEGMSHPIFVMSTENNEIV